MKNLILNLSRLSAFAANLALMSAPLPAFARNMDMEMNTALLRQEKLHEQTVRIAGKIDVNDGKIQITDTASGKIYRISQNTEISRIYSKGNRNIRIEGVLTGQDTVEARTVDTL